ncbi:hypothetical protein IG631_22619 [Alternaria alternata]|jgi:hypothetical protein|nr:hypothetical protein IG631_22619 [Alternaria alternata]
MTSFQSLAGDGDAGKRLQSAGLPNKLTGSAVDFAAPNSPARLPESKRCTDDSATFVVHTFRYQ